MTPKRNSRATFNVELRGVNQIFGIGFEVQKENCPSLLDCRNVLKNAMRFVASKPFITTVCVCELDGVLKQMESVKRDKVKFLMERRRNPR